MDRLTEILARLDALERRLAAVEQREESPGGTESTTGTSEHEQTPEPVEVLGETPAPPQAEPPPEPPPEQARPVLADHLVNLRKAHERYQEASSVEPAVREIVERVDPPPTLESKIGGKLFAALGAIIVVFGVGFFLKLAWDQGWIRLMPPEVRCLLGAGFGLALIAAGEVTFRRLGKPAAVGMFGAGIATLYGSAWAAFGVFSLVSAPVAFVLLALTIALGIAIALRSDSLPVGLLAILGGYLIPFVTNVPSPSPYVLPVHLTALLVLGLALSGWRPSTFLPIRVVVFVATLVIGGVWSVFDLSLHPGVILGFLVVVWGAVHVEAWLGARTERSFEEQHTDDESLPDESPPVWSIVISSVATLWAITIGIFAMREIVVHLDWMVPAGGFVATSVLWIVLGGHLRFFRDLPRTSRERLGAGLCLQSAALLITAVAIGITGWLQVVAWLAMGIAGAAAATWIGAMPLAVYGTVLLVIGTARIFMPDVIELSSSAGSARVLGLVLSWWSALVLACGLCWHALSRLVLRIERQNTKQSAMFSGGVGSILLFIAVFNPSAQPVSIAMAWLMLSWIFLGAHRLNPRLGLFWHAILGSVLASAAWLIDLPHATLAEHGVGLLIAASWAIGAIRCAKLRGAREFASIGAALAGAALFIALRDANMSGSVATIVWGAISLGLVFSHGFERRLSLDSIAMAGFFATIVSAAVAYPMDTWFASRVPAGSHAGLWLGLAMSSTLAIGAAWLRFGPRRWRSLAPLVVLVLSWGSFAVFFESTSVELARSADLLASSRLAGSGALTVWWAVLAVTLLIAGWRFSQVAMRYVGLALLGVCAAKALLFDLAELGMAWRIGSFLALGLVMLGVAAAYGGIALRAKEARRRSEDPDSTVDPRP